jgi:hypothetical protein
MPDKWPSVYEQFSAVLAAPIPFFLAVAIIAWAGWRAWQWRFRAVFEKQTELYELSRREVGHWKDLAERTTKDATQQVEQLKSLLTKEQRPTAETKAQFDQLMNTTARLNAQLHALGQANSSPASLNVRPGVWPPGSEVQDWTSEGWRRRNPTDSTSGSG